jgi:hypothetical protein
MKRSVWLLVGVLCLAAMVFGADKHMKKAGTICDSKCVTKVNDLNTCDTSCTEKSGEAVFVDDAGMLMQIENQDMAKPHMGKHVKMTCTEAQRENTLRILQLSQEAP